MKKNGWIVCFIWLGCMTWLMGIQRADFFQLWSIYTLAFAGYAWLIWSNQPIKLSHGLWLAFAARLITFFYEPLLSDDYFRFIWDGMLTYEGIHPMAFTPAYLMNHPDIFQVNEDLFSHLNSQNYYSVYPPLAQLIFTTAFKLNGLNIPGNILFLKSVLLVVDAIIIYLLYKLLQSRNQPVTRVFIYALNPLIILEFTGNLHMDGLMIVGLLGAILAVHNKKLVLGSGLMTFSIVSKLLTLILIPFMPKEMYWKKISFFSILTFVASVTVFWFSFGVHSNWLDSIRLWFQSFEFNAGIYYVMRSMGYLIKGYNTINVIGPVLGGVTLLGILIIWWQYIRYRKFDWPSAMLYVMTLYLMMSTTVHPWYLGILLTLSVISLHIFPVVWTYLIFLSYSHYLSGQFEEKYSFIAAEYLLLFGWMIWEWGRRNKKPSTEFRRGL